MDMVPWARSPNLDCINGTAKSVRSLLQHREKKLNQVNSRSAQRVTVAFSDSHFDDGCLTSNRQLVVNQSIEERVNDWASTHGAKLPWPLQKCGHHSIHHSMNAKHLHRYVYEFSHRHNTTKTSVVECAGMTIDGVVGRRLRYTELPV